MADRIHLGEKTHAGPSTKLGRWPQVLTGTNNLKAMLPSVPHLPA